jgi:hypothetical protein
MLLSIAHLFQIADFVIINLIILGLTIRHGLELFRRPGKRLLEPETASKHQMKKGSSTEKPEEPFGGTAGPIHECL